MFHIVTSSHNTSYKEQGEYKLFYSTVSNFTIIIIIIIIVVVVVIIIYRIN